MYDYFGLKQYLDKQLTDTGQLTMDSFGIQLDLSKNKALFIYLLLPLIHDDSIRKVTLGKPIDNSGIRREIIESGVSIFDEATDFEGFHVFMFGNESEKAYAFLKKTASHLLYSSDEDWQNGFRITFQKESFSLIHILSTFDCIVIVLTREFAGRYADFINNQLSYRYSHFYSDYCVLRQIDDLSLMEFGIIKVLGMLKKAKRKLILDIRESKLVRTFVECMFDAITEEKDPHKLIDELESMLHEDKIESYSQLSFSMLKGLLLESGERM